MSRAWRGCCVLGAFLLVCAMTLVVNRTGFNRELRSLAQAFVALLLAQWSIVVLRRLAVARSSVFVSPCSWHKSNAIKEIRE